MMTTGLGGLLTTSLTMLLLSIHPRGLVAPVRNEAAVSWIEHAIPQAPVQSSGAVPQANRASRQVGSATSGHQLAQYAEPFRQRQRRRTARHGGGGEVAIDEGLLGSPDPGLTEETANRAAKAVPMERLREKDEGDSRLLHSVRERHVFARGVLLGTTTHRLEDSSRQPHGRTEGEWRESPIRGFRDVVGVTDPRSGQGIDVASCRDE